MIVGSIVKQSDIHPNSQDPRWNEVRAALPIMRRCIALMTSLLNHDPENDSSRSSIVDTTCESPVQDAHQDIVEVREDIGEPQTLIPHPEHLPVEVLPIGIDERHRLQGLFEEYQACRGRLTSGQWSVICHRFRDGLTENQIACLLKKSRSSVHGLLQRACSRKEAYQKELREEAFLIRKQYLKKNE